MAAKLDYGTNYRDGSFEKTTGFVSSASHGNRLVVTYISPAASARIYRANAAKVRAGNPCNMGSFPAGTTIVKESFMKDREGGPGRKGPLFVMKKEGDGYDSSGNNWRYGFTRPDYRVIGDGFTGPVAFCKACHMSMRNQDFVFAVDR